MADEIYINAVQGLVVTLQLYQGSSTVGSPFSAIEIGATGIYVASVPGGVALGIYMVLAMAGDERLGSGLLYWNGEKEVTSMIYDEIHKIQGLDASNPMTATPTSRISGGIELDVTGYGTNTTIVTRA